MSKKTKIICTIGPASESKEVLTKLVEAGMNIARLNFSHGDYEEHAERVKRIREVSKETGKPIGILLDTKGPEIRLGDFENGGCEFNEGDEIDLVKEEVLGNLYIELGQLYSGISKDKELECYQKGVTIFKNLEII